MLYNMIKRTNDKHNRTYLSAGAEKQRQHPTMARYGPCLKKDNKCDELLSTERLHYLS